MSHSRGWPVKITLNSWFSCICWVLELRADITMASNEVRYPECRHQCRNNYWNSVSFTSRKLILLLYSEPVNIGYQPWVVAHTCKPRTGEREREEDHCKFKVRLLFRMSCRPSKDTGLVSKKQNQSINKDIILPLSHLTGWENRTFWQAVIISCTISGSNYYAA